MTTKTDSLILGRRHFRVEYVAARGTVATLWVPTELANTDDIFTEAERHARWHGEELDVRVAGERVGVRVRP